MMYLLEYLVHRVRVAGDKDTCKCDRFDSNKQCPPAAELVLNEFQSTSALAK
jgi:hypothetical protein